MYFNAILRRPVAYVWEFIPESSDVKCIYANYLSLLGIDEYFDHAYNLDKIVGGTTFFISEYLVVKKNPIVEQ